MYTSTNVFVLLNCWNKKISQLNFTQPPTIRDYGSYEPSLGKLTVGPGGGAQMTS